MGYINMYILGILFPFSGVINLKAPHCWTGSIIFMTSMCNRPALLSVYILRKQPHVVHFITQKVINKIQRDLQN